MSEFGYALGRMRCVGEGDGFVDEGAGLVVVGTVIGKM